MPQPASCLITTRHAASWDTIFMSLEKDESHIVERETRRGPLKLLRVTEEEVKVLVRSSKEKKLSFRVFLEFPTEQLVPLSIRHRQKVTRNPQVDAMREALKRQLARHEQISVH